MEVEDSKSGFLNSICELNNDIKTLLLLVIQYGYSFFDWKQSGAMRAILY